MQELLKSGVVEGLIFVYVDLIFDVSDLYYSQEGKVRLLDRGQRRGEWCRVGEETSMVRSFFLQLCRTSGQDETIYRPG